MRTDALVLLAAGKMDFTRVTVPDPGPDDVLVEMKANGRIDQRPLISHRFPFAESQQAFEAIANGLDGYMKGVLCF